MLIIYIAINLATNFIKSFKLLVREHIFLTASAIKVFAFISTIEASIT